MPIETIFIQGEALVLDLVDETGSANVIRTRVENQEVDGVNASGLGTNNGLPNHDIYGLRPDYTGTGDEDGWGYLDINGDDTGAQAATTFDAPAGTYEITLRLANGSGLRPISITVDDVTYQIHDTNTGAFYSWETRTIEVVLTGDGPHDLIVNQDGTAGAPNIDAIAIHDVGVVPNFSLPTFESEASFVVADGGTAVGAALATDIANDTSLDAPDRAGMIYAIAGGIDAGAFAIDPETGALTLTEEADFDAQPSYDLIISATDAEGGTTEQAITVAVVPPFAPIYLGVEDIEVLDPVGTGTAKRTTDENPESGAIEGGANDNTGPESEGNDFDDFGLRHNYSGIGYIDLNGGVGDKLSFTFDAPAGTYDITLRYANGATTARPISLTVDGGAAQTLADTQTGGWSTWDSHSFTVTVGDGTHTVIIAQTDGAGAPNIDAVAIALPGAAVSFAAPEVLSAAAFDIAENTTEIGQVLVDDPELSDLSPDVLSFVLTGPDADKVSVDASGLLTLNDPADFEAASDANGDGIFEVTLEVSDGVRSVTQELSITVTDVDPELPSPTIAPIVLQSETGIIPEGAETFHRVQNDPTTGEGSGNTPQDEYALRVGYSGYGYTDFGGAGVDGDESITWTVSVAETGLYELHIRYASVESTQTDRPVAVLVNGADAVGGNIGFPERDGFDTWVVRAPVQIALQAGENSLTLAIPAGFSNGPNIDAIAITSVGDVPTFPPVNTAPEFDVTSGAVVIDENSTEVAVGLTATDGEGDALSYELTGDDAALFEFNETTGALDFVTAPDFEAPADLDGDNVYEVTLTTSDGVLNASQDISVTVTDVVEATQPTSIALDASTVAENAAGAVIGTLSAVDPDGDDAAITFSVDPASDFEVVGGQLKLKDGVALDFEATPTIDVEITATDTANETTTTTLTITVGDVDEAPSQPQITGLTVDSGAAGAIIGTVSSVDPEGTAVSFTVDDARFQIDGDDQLTLLPGQSLDFASEPTVSVEVTAFDETGQSSVQTFVITVNDPGAVFEPIVIEAEDDTLAALTIVDNDANTNDTQIRDPENPESNQNLPNGLRPGFSGDGYLDFGDTPGDAITFTVNVATAGAYDLNVRYASNGARPLDLSVNGGGAVSLPFVTTDPDGSGPEEGFDHWLFQTVTVTLTAGDNAISLAIPAGATSGPNVDRIEITEAGTGPIPEPDTTADEGNDLAASPEAAAINPAALGAVEFSLAGVDADITLFEVSTDGGASFQPVTPVGDIVTLDLSAFAAETSLTVIFRVTDDAANTAETSAVIAIGDVPEAFSTTIQLENRDGSIIILDDTGTGEGDPASTQFRDADNIEGVTADRPEGIWSDYTGTGYLDMGGDIGDAVQFDVTVPEAGTYTMSFRYANASTTMPDRPMELQVNGQTVIVPFGMTPDWDIWEDIEVEVTLAAGANTVTLANTVANGPNIDSVTIFNDITPPPPPSEPGVRETIRINFQDGSTPVDPDYLVGNFTDFGLQSNGLTYGFVTEDSALDADGTTNTPTGSGFPTIAVNERSGSGTLPDDGTLPTEKLSVDFDAMDPRLTGYAHFDLSSFPTRTAWEIELENGWYEVTVSIGDTGGPNDSDNRLFVEGALVSEWTSTSAFKTELLTTLAHVQDGHLTLSAQGGNITEMQYLEIRALPDLTPEDGNEAPEDYAAFINPRAVSTDGEVELGITGGVLPTDINPTSDIVLGIDVVDGRGGVLLESLGDGSIRIYETLTGEEVAYNANTTGGFDSVTIAPVTDLKPYTSYTVVIDGFRDRGDNDDTSALTREFQKFTTTFTTGAAPLVEAREVAFNDTIEVNSDPSQGESYTSIEMSPDMQFLYVTSITGSITRWAVNADGSLDQSTKESWFPGGDFNVPGAGTRGIIGIAFDPEDDNTIWITDNYPIPLNGRSNSVPEFSGRISKVTLGEGGSLEDATIETYITGLPRSNGDHVTNSLEFRINPDYVPGGDEPQYLLYLTQGSNSAMGEPDSAWGFRPERLLNAAILEIDRTREAPEGGFDVSTEPIPEDGLNRRYADTDNDLKDGGIAITDGIYVGNYLHFTAEGVAEVRTGEDASSELITRYYDPYAEDAVLRIFAEGNRNAYDLVWHSNGYLYVPTNGSAAGGNVPDDPSTPEDEGINGVGLQADYLFRMVEDGYYGHPNPLRDKFILNGANPTSGTDPNQVGNYPVGTDPDPEYDLTGAYNLGNNRSPNGAIEYMSGVFGTSLQHAVIFTQYSSGDNLRAVLFNEDGTPAQDFILTDLDGNEINYVDPLDVIEGADGRLYMLTLNRSNGISQIIRLDAAPGGEIEDNTADEGGNLGLLVVSAADPANVLFQVVGLDPDIQSLTISLDGGPEQVVTLDAQNRFSLDFSGQTEQVSAVLTVNDDDGNSASTSTSFTPGDSASGNLIDASAFTVLDTDDGTLIRLLSDPSTHEAGGGTYDSNGDGMNDGYTGAGYLDMNGGAEDKAAFVYDAPSAGSYTLTFRMANGSGTPRPIAIIAGTQTVQVTSTDTGSFAAWQDFAVTLDLSEGPNTVIIEQLASNGGPNIDSVAVIANVPTAPNDGSETIGGVTYTKYEAENAELDGAVVATDPRNQSGGEFVDFDGTGTQSITWTVSVTEAGIYGMDILYALATTKDARPASLFVNGIDQGILAFEPNSSAGEDVWGPQSAQISLNAGLNTISISVPDANGANIDYLRVSEAPVDTFVPAYAAIDGEGRIELEATDDTTRTLGATQVEFYFTVASDDTYALDLAANAGAPDGAGLTVYLSANGAQPVEIGDIAFPGEGDAGETSAYVELTAGVQYKLTVISDQSGASALDYLDVRPAPGNDNADIEIQSNDPAYFDNRLHFSWIDNPTAVVADTPRDYKESATVTISNSGSEPLDVLEATISGPFELADPAVFDGLTLAAGQSINVEVLFDRDAYTAGSSSVSGVYKGTLDIRTNDADTPVATVDLAGFWQARDEGGQEPNINEVWDVFGFGNEIEGLTFVGGGESDELDFYDIYLPVDETEILSPYWRLADGVTEARITQIAAFHSPSGASMGIHAPGDKGADVGFTSHLSTNNQTLLPMSNSTSFATRVFSAADIPDGWAGNDLFGIEVAGLSTDPRLNPTGSGVPTQAELDARYPGYTISNGQVYDPDGNEVSDGYTVRVFQAVDEDGVAIENVFLGVMDYTGINYDYNDNMFIIEGVAPVYYGAVATIEGLDDAAADDRLVFSRIDTPANADQAFRDSAVLTITNDGISDLSIDDLEITGAFTLSGLAEGQVIAPGGSAQVTVTFIGVDPNDDNQATSYEGTLTIGSSAGVREIALAGLAQIQSEGGEEPTVAQIVQAFGYSTDVAQGLLSNGGVVETVGDEVLLPYLQRLDDSKPVEVIQIAAYLSAGVSRLSLHDVSNGALTELYAQDDNQYQTLLPDGLISGPGAQSGVARASIDRDDPFGLRVTVDGQPTFSAWSDPNANVADDTYNISPPNEGHYIRFFEARDSAGNVIEGTYIGIQDYPGGSNFDYNDHMFIVTNVQGYALSAAEDADADGVNDALVSDSDLDGTPDFFDADNSPAPVQQPYPGPAPVLDETLTVVAANFDSGGQGISWNDDPGRDGSHPLRADTDVELVGATNDIGYVQPGEWVEYTIDVAQAGNYALSINAKTPIGGNSVIATLEDGTPLATFALPDSNGSSTSFSGTVFAPTAATTVALEAGLQTLRFTFEGALASNGYILDFRSFTLEQVTVDPEPEDDVAPVVDAVIAADITIAGGATASVVVTFSDDVALDASSIDVTDITVTGPGGPLAVTGVSLDTGSDGTPRSATYTVAAPGGSWDTADNGAYTVALAGGQVLDTSGNAVAANAALASFNVAVPDTPPPEDDVAPVVDTVIATDITIAGAATASVVVTFSDDVALDASSIDVGDITVTGPSGPLVVTGVSLDTGGDGSPRSATYTVAAPGGSWDTADNGAYTVALAGGQVLDTSGNAVAANAALTSFNVAVPVTPPPTGTGETFRVEAETLTLQGFVAASNPHASNGQFIQAPGAGTNVASMSFAETAGTYEITVGHFDESDGNAVLSLLVNGVVRETFTWDQNAGDAIANPSSFNEYTFAGVALAAGDVVAISGQPDGGEPLRVDYLDFTSVDGGGEPVEDLQAPIVTSVSAAGIASAGGGTTTVTVTYADNVAVDASSIDVGDITVTGPGGPLTVTGVTLNAGGDGSPRSATYTVAAPGGSWDTADNGAYTVALAGGQVLDTSGNAVAANAALTSFNVAVPVTPPPSAEPVRVEAETMDLQGFVAANNVHASNGQFIQAPGGGTNVAGFNFAGAEGVYNLKLGYFDESDGQSQLSLLLNGEEIDSFVWDADAGGSIVNSTSYAEREIVAISIETGDLLQLSGTPDGGEPLRIDFLEYAFVGDLPIV